MNKIEIQFPINYTRNILPRRAEWVAALRSNEFAQGTGGLCEEGKYCCLGVLSKTQGRLIEKGFHFCDGMSTQSSMLMLSEDNPVFRQLDRRGEFNTLGITVMMNDSPYTCLTELNDAGATFEEIANVIDQIWK